MKQDSKFRKLQNWSANRNWRIEYIFYPDDKGILVTSIKNPMGWISLAGVALFLGGFTYIFIKRAEIANIAYPLSACLVGFAMAAAGSIFHERIRKRNWITVKAECQDHELILGRTHQNSHLWKMRTLCKYELSGENILSTPEITWAEGKGENWKFQFIKETQNGMACTLRVNPENPYETQIIRLG